MCYLGDVPSAHIASGAFCLSAQADLTSQVQGLSLSGSEYDSHKLSSDFYVHVVAPKPSPDKISNKKMINGNSLASALIISW